MSKPTIIDISKATGFSKSTISKALSDSKEISKKTKSIIVKYAKKINYKPNFYASHLRKSIVKNVAIIIPDILNYYFAKVLKGVQYAKVNNYRWLYIILYLCTLEILPVVLLWHYFVGKI